jgi:hypothetical protein
MRRSPNRGARWVATHPVLGAVLLAPVFAAILAANVFWLTDLSSLVVGIGFVFFALYGPSLAWVIRRNIERLDVAHPH